MRRVFVKTRTEVTQFRVGNNETTKTFQRRSSWSLFSYQTNDHSGNDFSTKQYFEYLFNFEQHSMNEEFRTFPHNYLNVSSDINRRIYSNECPSFLPLLIFASFAEYTIRRLYMDSLHELYTRFGYNYAYDG